MITPETTIKELLEHPIGHDVISKILMQMGVTNKWIDNPVVGKLKLKQLEKMYQEMDTECKEKTKVLTKVRGIFRK